MFPSILWPAAIAERATVFYRPIFWGGAFYLVAVLVAALNFVHNDSKQALLVLVLAGLWPLGIYTALSAPLIFPFCAYIMVLPFDSLSSLGSGGTLAKLLGAMSGVAILAKVFRRGASIAPPGAVAAWAVLLFWMGISLLWALDLHDAMTAFQMYGSLMALFALTAIVRVSSKEFNFVLGSVVLAGVISAAFDAYLYHSGQSLVAANAGATRVIITNGDAYIDPNALAASLVLPTALALYFLFNSRFIVLSILMIPVLGILLLGFAASGSRGGFMQLAAVFIYLIVRSRHRLWLATLMIVATITTLLANPGLPGRFADAQQDGGAGRRDIWHIGLYAFHDYWFTGAGIGNFPNAFDQEYIKVYSEYVMGWHWVAHNVPLQIATELGVVGLCVFAFATFMQLRLLHKLALDDRVKFEMRLVLEAACLGLIVSGFSGSNLNSKYVWLAFSAMALFRGSLLSERFVEHHSRSVNNNYEPPLKMSAVEAHIGGI